MIKPDEFQDHAAKAIRGSILTKERLLNNTEILATICSATSAIIEALERGKKVLLFGNGGSAADAQHIAAEFVGRFGFDRPALPALALSVNTSCLTAIGNDYGYELVFSRQIEALASPGDIAIGISTSGNSPNIAHALQTSRAHGLHTVALTGCTGGKIKNIVDFCICAPSDETPRIQECHILIGHILAEAVEQAIFHEQSGISRS